MKIGRYAAELVKTTFLAERTNGRAYATVLSFVVCLSSVRNALWLNGASWSKKSYYWQPIGSRIWEIDWYQNEWPWPLFRGRLRSREPLHHIRHRISRKPLEIEAWFWPPTENGIWGIKWCRDRWRHVTPKSQTRDPNTLRAQYLENSRRCYWASMAAVRQCGRLS